MRGHAGKATTGRGRADGDPSESMGPAKNPQGVVHALLGARRGLATTGFGRLLPALVLPPPDLRAVVMALAAFGAAVLAHFFLLFFRLAVQTSSSLNAL